MKKRLTIKLFGQFSLELDGKPLTGLSSKAEALLAYLVSQKRPFSRETLADFLWDDRPPDQSLANFRSLLSGLRRHVGDHLLISRQTVEFDTASPYQLDTELFLEHLEPLRDADVLTFDANQIAAIETAVSHYEGTFLEAFHIRESRRFEEWVTIERERFQRLAVNVWHRLIDYHLRHGNYAVGIEHAVRLLETDPLNENAHRQMMLLLARNNQRHSAMQQYDACVAVLDDELGVPPSNETVRLYEQIRSAHATPLHNLPPQATQFIGREPELAELHRILARPNGRFVTMLGPGGVGKTRLALQLAQQIVDQQPGLFLHGIRFASLVAVEHPQFLVSLIANVVDLPLRGAEKPEQQLVAYLAEKEMLLILDNFEQLVGDETAVSLLSNIIRHCPQIKLIVTSRMRLNIAEETVFDMRGLQFPRNKAFVAAENYGAVQLFIQNARRYLRAFQPTASDMEAIIQTCRLLDGMPLGIELASAWVRFLSCEEIVADLTASLDMAEQEMIQASGQHKTLHAAFDRSWTLLDKPLQSILCQLSLFQGSFTREAAQAVAQSSLAHLVRLMDSSWLRRAEGDGAVRFDMLLIMRQYAQEKLAGMDDGVKTAVIQRYIQFYADYLTAHFALLRGDSQLDALNDISSESENLQQMVRLAIAEQQLDAIEAAADTLFYFYDTRSQFLAGRTLFEQMHNAVKTFPKSIEQEKVLAKLQARVGWFLFHQGQYHACRLLLQSSADRLKQLDFASDAVFSLNYLGAIQRHFGDYQQAEAALNEALAIAQAHDDQFGASLALNILGQVASLRGNFDAAQELCQQANELKKQVGDQWGMTHSLLYLGRVAEAKGEFAKARSLFEESMAISKAFSDQRGVAFGHQNLGDVALAEGVYETAVSHYTTALQLYQSVSDRLGSTLTLAKEAQALAYMQHTDRARRQLLLSLEAATQLASTPAMLEGVLATAVLHHAQNEAKAAALLHYVNNHSGSSQAQKAKATRYLDALAQTNEPLELPIGDLVAQIVREETAVVVH